MIKIYFENFRGGGRQLPSPRQLVNPQTNAFRDYENRQRQIEADRILADRLQQQELQQQQRLSDSSENQTSSTATDEEVAVCLLANYLHQQEGSTSQLEPEQTFSRATCSSSDITNRAELDDVIAHSLLESTRLECNPASLTNTERDTAGDQQALKAALSLSLLESQQNEGQHDDMSSQRALDEAIAMSLSTPQYHDHNESSHQQALDEAIALSLSTPQASGRTRGDALSENLEYEDLLEIEDLVGSVGAMKLSSNQLQMLPTHKYKERLHKSSNGVDEREKSCAICLTMYESGSDVKLLPCLHTFHEKCIDEWLQRKAVCPACNIQVEI